MNFWSLSYRSRILEMIYFTVQPCKSGLSIVTNDGNSSIAYGGWYKQNLLGDYRLHSYDARGNRVLINDKNFFLSKNKDDIWMVRK